MDQLNIGTDIDRAAALLTEGNIVAIPTETVYGLSANALNDEAVIKVFKAKNRPSYDPLIVHTDTLDKVLPYLEKPIPEITQLLSSKYWPGPLSIIFKKKSIGFSNLITSGHPTVAIRIPDHPMTLSLLKKVDFPLVAPSANPFGYVSPVTPEHVERQLGKDVAYILDGGRCTIGLESTILDLSVSPPVVRRKGGVLIEELKELVPNLKLADTSSSNPSSPGMLLNHYSTKAIIHIGKMSEIINEFSSSEIGGLFFCKAHPRIPLDQQRILSRTKNLKEAAHHLFSYMRELDRMGMKVILTEWMPDVGLGKAINDKLKRASHRSDRE